MWSFGFSRKKHSVNCKQEFDRKQCYRHEKISERGNFGGTQNIWTFRATFVHNSRRYDDIVKISNRTRNVIFVGAYKPPAPSTLSKVTRTQKLRSEQIKKERMSKSDFEAPYLAATILPGTTNLLDLVN